ncbi:MAG TPA: 4-alpha-glucanotransferase [Candidatus Limenecus avicola]|uniref:4-alpha-glucanotransferase n=1 Tax=Candidatus Limenecus avicola TaxID=2840847 RepID=A0A9D1N082_9CLOT|nr:4-alpha-glucanotransferase [Candidatus Limenecus avicola]
MICCENKAEKRDMKKFKKVCHKALKELGKKNFALIVHGNSFPAISGKNTGFGTQNSEAGKNLMDFASGVFNAIQLGPQGKTKACDSSPYTGTIFSINPLFIDLEQLTTKEWGNILSEQTYKKICDENPNKDINKTAYSYIVKAQEEALQEAYVNFKQWNDKKLNKEFEKFKSENDFWLSKDALYEALVIENNNDYWPLWDNKTDRNLFNPKTEEEKKASFLREKELRLKYADEINYYAFCQFVAAKQNEQTKKYALKHDLKLIADRQVAFSDRDTWAYQSLFLEGWMLGCPPDYFSKDGQAWGFPVVDPKKMFNEDGSLGEAGELLKRLYKKMFKENPGGVRIDHIVGLIDPWVYKAGKKPMPEQGAGRLYSSPEHPELSQYAIATMDDLNLEIGSDKEKRVKQLSKEQIKKYGAMIEKIVIAAAKEEGLNKDAIVCEDLGTLTFPVESVMKEYDLQGMRLTQFVKHEMPEHPYRCCNIVERSWAMVGTHDNEPISMWADSMINTHEGYLNVVNLVDDMYSELQGKDRDDLIVKLTTDAKALMNVKLAEIFASKAANVQVFFTDFFGIKATYNTPGTSGDKNWSLRVPDNFEEVYCSNCKDGLALNLPLILKMAIEARGSKFAKKQDKLLKELEKLI